MHVSGKTALVTGAGSGLGRSIALALAEAGADVAITELASRMENARTVAASIRSLGRKALVVKLDVTSVKNIERAVAEVIKAFSRIDILVNNAGINIPRRALDVTEDDWDRILDVNLKGVFFCAQAVGRQMVRQGSGKIINMASQNGVVGYHDRAAYCSSKAGVVNLTRVLAIEWAQYQINVNAVAPTFVLTPLTEKMFANRAVFERNPPAHTAGKAGNAGRCRRGGGLPGKPGSRFDHRTHAAGGWRLDGDLDMT